MPPVQREPQAAFATQDAFRAWVAEQPEGSPGVWLRIARAGTGIPSVTYAEALDVALAHGWIDGQKARIDDAWWLQRFLPRRPRSRWSQVNRDKALALIEAGAMQPAGMREVERARADGRWEQAYAGPARAAPPDDLLAALDAAPGARAFFDALDSANRYAIVYRVQEAKRPETRARRIADLVAKCAAGETLHPRRSRRGA